jgi:hypothetical protein
VAAQALGVITASNVWRSCIDHGSSAGQRRLISIDALKPQDRRARERTPAEPRFLMLLFAALSVGTTASLRQS